MSSSPSSMPSAMMPAARGRANWSSRVLLDEPAARRHEDELRAAARPRSSGSALSSAPRPASAPSAVAGRLDGVGRPPRRARRGLGSRRTGRIAATFSPCASCTRFTIGFPRAARPACGISCTFSQ